MALVLKHQTAERFVQRVREAYREGDPDTLVKIARFILARLSAGDITDAQCRNAFGLTQNQWNSLKNRMQNLVDADNAIQSATGE
jgi:hypothetical protein